MLSHWRDSTLRLHPIHHPPLTLESGGLLHHETCLRRGTPPHFPQMQCSRLDRRSCRPRTAPPPTWRALASARVAPGRTRRCCCWGGAAWNRSWRPRWVGAGPRAGEAFLCSPGPGGRGVLAPRSAGVGIACVLLRGGSMQHARASARASARGRARARSARGQYGSTAGTMEASCRGCAPLGRSAACCVRQLFLSSPTRGQPQRLERLPPTQPGPGSSPSLLRLPLARPPGCRASPSSGAATCRSPTWITWTP